MIIKTNLQVIYGTFEGWVTDENVIYHQSFYLWIFYRITNLVLIKLMALLIYTGQDGKNKKYREFASQFIISLSIQKFTSKFYIS